MIVTGTLASQAEERFQGSQAAAAAAIGVTSVTLASVQDFRPVGICQIGDDDDAASYAYILDDDEPILHLDDPLTIAVAVGDQVYSMTDTSRPESQVFAWVQISDDGRPVKAAVPSALRVQALSTTLLIGAEVTLESHPTNGYTVRSLPLETTALDTITGTTIQTSADGPRAVLMQNPDVDGGVLLLYTGHPAEHPIWGPGFITASSTDLGGGDVILQTGISGPSLDGGPAAPTIGLSTMDIGGVQQSFLALAAERVTLNGDRIEAPNFYVTDPPTTSEAANVRMGPAGQILKITSSARYKRDIEPAPDRAEAFLSLSGSVWRDLNDDEAWHVGFVAEHLHAAGLSEYVIYDDEGRPDAIRSDRLTVPLLQLAQKQQARLDDLERRLAALEG